MTVAHIYVKKHEVEIAFEIHILRLLTLVYELECTSLTLQYQRMCSIEINRIQDLQYFPCLLKYWCVSKYSHDGKISRMNISENNISTNNYIKLKYIKITMRLQ